MTILTRPKVILFDFDDTLIDTKPIINKALEATFTKFKIDIESYRNIDLNRSLKDYFQEIFKDNLNEARDTYYQHYREYSKVISPLANAEEVLSFLKNKNVYIAIVSNKTSSILHEEITNKLNWRHYFSSIVGSGDAEEDKPSTKPVELALKNFKLDSLEHVWLIGDSLIDLKTAENFGCKGILFGKNIFVDKPKFHLEVRNHRQLLNILEELL